MPAHHPDHEDDRAARAQYSFEDAKSRSIDLTTYARELIAGSEDLMQHVKETVTRSRSLIRLLVTDRT